MRTSESIKNIAPALLSAQKLMGGAKKGASNPYFKSRYADLGAVLEACKELLNEAGVTILQPHTSNERGKFVETILLHTSGEWVSSETEIVVAKQGDPQAQGSAITYARRYGLQSLLSMPAEDDDGEGAMDRRSLRQGGEVDEAKPAAQAPKRAKPETKAEPKAAPVAAPVGTGSQVPEAPPEDRKTLNEMLGAISRVVVQKKLATVDDLLKRMQSEFGTARKEDLTDQQARKFYGDLRGMVS